MDHPHIVTLHNTFQDDQNIYLCLEECAGGVSPGCRVATRDDSETYNMDHTVMLTRRNKYFSFLWAEHDDPPQKTNPLYRTRSEGVHDTTHLGRHVHARSPSDAQGSEVGERFRDG